MNEENNEASNRKSLVTVEVLKENTHVPSIRKKSMRPTSQLQAEEKGHAIKLPKV